jgi:hypothetical protein
VWQERSARQSGATFGRGGSLAQDRCFMKGHISNVQSARVGHVPASGATLDLIRALVMPRVKEPRWRGLNRSEIVT